MRQFIKTIFYIGFSVLAACSTTKEYTLVTLEPASVDLESTIKRIGIINESIVQ